MQIQTENSQIIDDDSLIRIFSFIPPIPFFFTTIPLINKQLFQYFFNFVTTCPIEELNYFQEINFWEFDCSLEEPVKNEHVRVLANHYRLLFGERNNNFFNTLQKRILETTETIFLPSWSDIADKIHRSQLLADFKNLKTIVFPSIYKGYKMSREKICWPQKKQEPNEKIQKQSFIFLNWEDSFVQTFFRKYFNAIDMNSKKDKANQKIPQIEKIVLVDMDEDRTRTTEETRKKFQNSNFFLKTTPHELLFNLEHDKMGGIDQKEAKIDGNPLHMSKSELEEFRKFSGFNKQTLEYVENHPEVNQFHFSILDDQKLIALLDYFGNHKSQISNFSLSKIQGIMNALNIKIDKLTFLLSKYFLDGWAPIVGCRKDTFDFEPNETFFGEIFTSFKKRSILTEVDQVKLVKIDQQKVNDEPIVLYDYVDFINNNGLNVGKCISGVFSKKLDMIVQVMHWDILRISFLQKNLDKLIESSRRIGEKAEIAKRTLKNLRKLWKICFSVTNFGRWMMKFDHVMIFKLWHKLDTDLVRKIFGKTDLHCLIPFLLDSGEPDDSPNFAGILNTPSPKTGEFPIDILLKKDPYYAIALVDGELTPTRSCSSPSHVSIDLISHPQVPESSDLSEIVEKMELSFRVKRIANSNEINEQYIFTKIIQSGQFQKIPFDLIHEEMESFSIEDIVMPLENQIPPQIYEISKTKATFDQFDMKILQIFNASSTRLDSCLHNLDNVKVFSSHFNEVESMLNMLISIFEGMFQNLMKSAHILKSMFDTQYGAKKGTKLSISTFLDEIVHEKLDLFPQLPRKQKVNFVEFKMDDSPFRDRERIESSEYVQKTFREIMKIAAHSFKITCTDDEVLGFEDLINLASMIQEKQSTTTSKEYLCELLALLRSIQQFFKSEKREEFYSKNIDHTSTRKLSQILKDSEFSKLHNQFLKKISESRQNLDKLIREDQKQQIYHTILLKTFKLLFDLEYYHFQIAGYDWKISDGKLSMAHFFASNKEPFQLEEEKEEENNRNLSCFDIFSSPHTQDQEILDDKKRDDCGTYFFRKYSKSLPRSDDETEEITLLINPLHKITSQQNETQKEARLNNFIFRSVILNFASFDFEVFEKFPNMKLFPQEIEILRSPADEGVEEMLDFQEKANDFSDECAKQVVTDFSERMNEALEKICPDIEESETEEENDSNSDGHSKKRKKESEDSEEQDSDDSSPKRRKLEKNDENED